MLPQQLYHDRHIFRIEQRYLCVADSPQVTLVGFGPLFCMVFRRFSSLAPLLMRFSLFSNSRSSRGLKAGIENIVYEGAATPLTWSERAARNARRK